jgi:hypothetical protein
MKKYECSTTPYIYFLVEKKCIIQPKNHTAIDTFSSTSQATLQNSKITNIITSGIVINLLQWELGMMGDDGCDGIVCREGTP